MKYRRLLIYLLVASGVLVAAAQGIIGNLVTDQLPADLKPHAAQLFIGITLAAIIVAEALYHAQEATKTYERRLQHRDRQRFLSRIHARYVHRRDESFRGFKRLALTIREETDAVAVSSSIYRQSQDHQAVHLWTDTHIKEAFDTSERALLLVGPPGAGKTTLLLDLALELAEIAREDNTVPIPVLFSLASWAIKRRPLDEWMLAELTATYHIPELLANSWLISEEIMPLLDGLDEVDLAHRASCVDAINSYHRAHGLVPLVVSSRTADYVSIGGKLELGSAVAVESASVAQLDTYLDELGEPFEGLRDATRRDSRLRELLTNPLLLNIGLLTYQDVQATAIPPVGEMDAWQDQLFHTYVARMLSRPRAGASSYAIEHVTTWLGWLARQMTEHRIMELYLERLQPDWLPRKATRMRFRMYTVAIMFVGCSVANALAAVSILGPQRAILFGAVFGLTMALLLGVFAGDEIEFNELTVWSWSNALRGAVCGFLCDLGWVIGADIGTGLHLSRLGTVASIGVGITLSALLGWYVVVRSWRPTIVIYSVFILIQAMMLEILSPGSASIFTGFSAGVIPGMLEVIGFASSSALFYAIVAGLTSNQLDAHDLTTPGESIRRSAKNSILSSLLISVSFGLLFVVIGPVVLLAARQLTTGQAASIPAILLFQVTHLMTWLPGAAQYFLPFLVGVMFYIGLIRGGLPVLQYAILQRQLRREGVVPSGLANFLQYCAECALLQRSGAGYRFIHPLFQAFFAEQILAPGTHNPVAISELLSQHASPSAKYWINKGLQLNEAQRYEEALVAFDHAIEGSPDNAYVWNLKGFILGQLHQLEQALTAIERACELAPRTPIYWGNQANILYDLGRNEEALKAYEKALTLDSTMAGTLAMKGNVLEDLGRSSDALAAYEQALALDPDAAWVWRNKASVLIERMGQFDEALAAAQRATQLDPQSVRGWCLVGDALLGEERNVDALAAYRWALDLPADDALAQESRANALMVIGRPAEALEAFERALAAAPEADMFTASLYLGKGTALGMMSRYEEALAAFDRATAIDPRSDALYLMAACLRAAGRTQEATDVEIRASAHGQPATSTRFFIAQIERHGTDQPLFSIPDTAAISAPSSSPPSISQPPSVFTLVRPVNPTKRQKKSRSAMSVARPIAIVLALVLVLTGSAFLYIRKAGVGTLTLSTVYSDPLNGSTASGWPNYSTCFSKSDGYHITGNVICYAPAGYVDNGAITVSVRQTSGSDVGYYGLVIRRMGQGNYYWFEINSSGEWTFYKVVNSTVISLVDVTSTPAIKKGLHQINTLSIHAIGSHFTFFINGVQIGAATDSTFATGLIGLSGTSGMDVVFTNLSVANVVG